jgi:hypothetical protein
MRPLGPGWCRKALATVGVAVALTVGAAAQEAPDALLTTPITPQILATGNELDAYTLGVQAYVWGYPLVRMERVARQYTIVPTDNPDTSYRAPLDRIGWARDLATSAAKDMPTANNDTFYMSAVVRLDEPFILSVPDTHDRYYVVNVFNMWQELQHYIGRRTTGTSAARYAIVPPGWQGELPAGISRLDVSTNKVWLWGRLRIAEGEDKDPVLALEQQFKLVPLSQLGQVNEASGLLRAARRGAEGQCSQFGRRGTVRAVRAHRSEPRWLRSVQTQCGTPQRPGSRAEGRSADRDLRIHHSSNCARRLELGNRPG